MYGIHRIEKRCRSSVYGIQLEANRTQEDHIKGRKFHGSDIDWLRTDENYYICKSSNWNESINKVLNENGIKSRKNSIVLLDAIYTASPEFFESMSKDEIVDYFKSCLDFHKKAYGDFVINCVIHFDEKNPHMHVASIPLYQKGDSYCLSARDLMGGRDNYRKRQDDFYAEVSSLWGLERGEVKEYGEVRKHINKMDYEAREARIRADKAKAELNIRERVNNACKNDNLKIQVLNSTSENKLLKKPATTTIATSDYELLLSQVSTSRVLKKGLDEMNKLASDIIAVSSVDERLMDMENQILTEKSKSREIEKQNRELSKKLKDAFNYIDQIEYWMQSVKDWLNARYLFQDFIRDLEARERAQQRDREREEYSRV